MTRHHLSLWALLASAFIIFTVTSATGLPEIGGHRLKSSQISETIFARHVQNDCIADSTIAAPDTTETDIFPVPVDSTAQTILFIGDSMLEGLGPRLAAYAESNGHTLYTVIWYSSTSETWGRSDKLRGYIDRLHPSYVFVCLGANELFVPDIANRRREYVEKIVADIDTLPFVWIGPPNWKPDTGINGLIAESTPRGTFFLSDGMEFARSRDGAHPTRTSAALWMDSVARWMPANCLHPILMAPPQTQTGRARRIFVHQPDER